MLTSVGRSSVRVALDSLRDLQQYRDRRTTPVQIFHDDVYFVSFPKSGATWINFLLANINSAMSGVSVDINFFNVHQYVPDIHMSRNISPHSLSFPGFRFIKSHAQLNQLYGNVFYIVRDPFDVMASYHKYLTGLNATQCSLDELVRSKKYGIKSWRNHVDRWLNQTPVSLPFLLVRYEDLKSDTSKEIRRIYGALGFNLPTSVIDRAVEKCSFEKMARNETELSYGGRRIHSNFKFMNKGKTSEGQNLLGDDARNYVYKIAGDLMGSLGYK